MTESTVPPSSPRPSDPAVAARRARLLHRIRRRYETVTDHLRFGPLALDFTRVADPDVVLDLVAAEEDRRDKLAGRRRDGNELHLPYWAELWDSAHGVADYLADTLDPARAGEMEVLDLGCGMGLAGTAAAALGARVTFADLSPDALVFARLNALPWEERIETRRMNWQTDRLPRRYDLILGADILYERVQWPFLEPFWRGHLKPGGTVLLGEPGRQTGELFVEWIRPWPWTVERLERAVATRKTPIKLFRLSGR